MFPLVADGEVPPLSLLLVCLHEIGPSNGPGSVTRVQSLEEFLVVLCHSLPPLWLLELDRRSLSAEVTVSVLTWRCVPG